MAATPRGTAMSAHRAHHVVRQCLRGLGDLPAFVCRRDQRSGRIDWWPVREDERRLRPFDFEFLFQAERRRDAYHAENFARVRRSRAHHVGTLHGFSDLYVPIELARGHTLLFVVGQWASTPPTRSLLEGVWKTLSGRDGTAADAQFRRWVRCCLEVPVLTDELCEGLVHLGHLLGRLPSSVAAAHDLLREIEGLRARCFLPAARDDSWVASCLDVDGLVRPLWGLDEFPPSPVVEEMRLDHLPSAVGLLMLEPRMEPSPEVAADRRRRDAAGEPEERREDLVAEWLYQHRFQRAALACAQQGRDCVAAPLGDGAVMLAIAVEPTHVEGRRARLEARVRLVQRELRQQGFRTVAGLGPEIAPGEALGKSYRGAAAALEQALRRGREFHRGAGVARPGPGIDELRALSRRIVIAFARRDFDDARASASHLAREVLAGTGAAPGAMAVHFHLVVSELLAVLESSETLSPHRRAALLREHLGELNAVLGPLELLAAFERVVSAVLALAREERTADRDTRLRVAAAWIDANLRESALVAMAARRAGWALPSFRREFRRAYGQTLGQWVRQRRLVEAERLLRLTALDVAEVGREVGMPEVHTFIRCFRARFGDTPARFRRSSRAPKKDRRR